MILVSGRLLYNKFGWIVPSNISQAKEASNTACLEARKAELAQDCAPVPKIRVIAINYTFKPCPNN